MPDHYDAVVDLSEREGAVRRHPWEVARSGFFRSLIARHAEVTLLRSVLDIGAGDGWFAGELLSDVSHDCELVCWDVNYTSEDLQAQLGPRVRRVTDVPNRTFDLVLLLDVIEHIADDAAFLEQSVIPRLQRDSVLVVSVPAFQTLYSDHDRALGHERRYRPAALHELLADRVDIVEHGGLFTTLLAPRLLSAAAERIGRRGSANGVGAWTGGPALTSALTGVLGADASAGAWLARHGVRLPGLSTWAVCRAKYA
ncbi:MAG: class I SAM-dependent methyltransferase [Actinomycetota bacterium]|nr:class I SAM-dependent methyltransferase [Actinomycetota bacterium]